jgi:hypothetical protein
MNLVSAAQLFIYDVSGAYYGMCTLSYLNHYSSCYCGDSILYKNKNGSFTIIATISENLSFKMFRS